MRFMGTALTPLRIHAIIILKNRNGGARMEYAVIRSQRKTIAMQIKRGQVIVREPALWANASPARSGGHPQSGGSVHPWYA